VTADATDFAAGLLEGFRTSYGAIAARAGELAAVHGPLGRFAGDELRVVVRATRVYANLLYESTHPDVLRDALDRDRILDYLWTLSRDDLARQRLIDHEQADLWAGDVPFFAVRPGSSNPCIRRGTAHDAAVQPGVGRIEVRERSDWLVAHRSPASIGGCHDRVREQYPRCPR
jgi:lantibiotic modifying enzyme